MVQVLVPGYRDWRDRRREHAEQQIDAPRAARVTGKNGRVDSERGLFDPDQIVRIREADDFTYSGLRPVLFLFFFVGRKAIAS